MLVAKGKTYLLFAMNFGQRGCNEASFKRLEREKGRPQIDVKINLFKAFWQGLCCSTYVPRPSTQSYIFYSSFQTT